MDGSPVHIHLDQDSQAGISSHPRRKRKAKISPGESRSRLAILQWHPRQRPLESIVCFRDEWMIPLQRKIARLEQFRVSYPEGWLFTRGTHPHADVPNQSPNRDPPR